MFLFSSNKVHTPSGRADKCTAEDQHHVLMHLGPVCHSVLPYSGYTLQPTLFLTLLHDACCLQLQSSKIFASPNQESSLPHPDIGN